MLSTLFVYGTLCNPRTRRRVLGRAGLTAPAVLAGYRRVNGKWPYLVKKSGARVRGLILRGLSRRDWKKLDAYEDVGKGLYRRGIITINRARHFVYLPDLKKWPVRWR